MIDFGVSKIYQSKSGEHLEARSHGTAIGSLIFSSIHAHERIELSRRDDLISLIYSVLYLSEKSLPWVKHHQVDEIGDMKNQHPLTELVQDFGPQFVKIAEHIQGLGYADKPNYSLLHNLIQQIEEKPVVNFEWMITPSNYKKGKYLPTEFDPTGFLLSISPFLVEEKKCLLL